MYSVQNLKLLAEKEVDKFNISNGQLYIHVALPGSIFLHVLMRFAEARWKYMYMYMYQHGNLRMECDGVEIQKLDKFIYL
jgi:hypothetical protein